MKPVFIIHGGALDQQISKERRAQKEKHILEISAATASYLESHSALETVQFAVQQLEDCELFNAGTGSCIQSDGQVRMSAAIMDGNDILYGSVINVQNVRHPIDLARYLLDQKDCVQDAQGAAKLKEVLCIPDHNAITSYRHEQYLRGRKSKTGTVGAVAMDAEGHLASATSTGGRGNETVGRVSDSCMPSSTYATKGVAVACTGIGEHIIKHSPAVKLAAYLELQPDKFNEHIKRIEKDARAKGFAYGLIAVRSSGEYASMHTTPDMVYSGSI